MAWFADMARCDYCGLDRYGDLRAIGWLERDVPFMTGRVGNEFFSCLCLLLQDLWCPIAWGGWHDCMLCQFSAGGRSTYEAPYVGRFEIFSRGSSVLLVPGAGVLYAAPNNVAHYIDAHHYLPPKAFQDAVLRCPPMATPEYFTALLANGASDHLRSCIATHCAEANEGPA